MLNILNYTTVSFESLSEVNRTGMFPHTGELHLPIRVMETALQKRNEKLTLHANKQQVGRQCSPVSLGLLFVDPVPIETKKIDNNLLSYCVI